MDFVALRSSTQTLAHIMSNPKPSPTQDTESRASAATRLTATTRVDLAHVVASDAVESLSAEAAPPNSLLKKGTGSELSSENAAKNSGREVPVPLLQQAAKPIAEAADSEPVRRQAEQLAAYLGARQKELDHREAELNSLTARLESDARAARLWLGERETDLAAQSSAIARQQEELARRLEKAAKQEAELAQARQTAAKQQQALTAAQQEVEKRLTRLAATAAIQEKHSLAPLSDLGAAKKEFEAERQRAEDALRRERRQIEAQREESERLIRQAQADLDRRRETLEAQAAQWEKQQRSSVLVGDLHEREETCRRENDSLDARRQFVEQSEMRLAAAQAEVQKMQEELLIERRAFQEEAAARAAIGRAASSGERPTSSRNASRSSAAASTWTNVGRRWHNSAANWAKCTARRSKSAWPQRSFGRSFQGRPRRRP